MNRVGIPCQTLLGSCVLLQLLFIKNSLWFSKGGPRRLLWALDKNLDSWPGTVTVAHACNPRSLEAETGGSEFKASLSNYVRPYTIQRDPASK